MVELLDEHIDPAPPVDRHSPSPPPPPPSLTEEDAFFESSSPSDSDSPSIAILMNSMNRSILLDMAIRDVEAYLNSAMMLPGEDPSTTMYSLTMEGDTFVRRRTNAVRVSRAIERLPFVQAENEDCAVCLEQGNNETRQLRQLPCNHSFCDTCLTNWLRISLTCPLCRVDLSPLLVLDNSTQQQQTSQDAQNYVIPASHVQNGLRILRQIVYAMMCDDARQVLHLDD